MKKVDVIIPTIGHIKKTAHPYQCFERLKHIPWPISLHIVTRGTSWAKAVNIGIKETSGENDIVLMDDDVFLNEFTFDLIDRHYESADIFGFKLLFPDGRLQHCGGAIQGEAIGHIGHGMEDEGKFSNPYYVCHATTSLIYIKREVIDRLGGMAEDIPGIQMEDVDFSFRAIKSGFRILYLPSEATHIESATKRSIANFQEGINEAFQEVKRRHLNDKTFYEQASSFPKPLLVTA